MPKYVWGIRIGFLLLTVPLLLGAIQLRRDYEADSDLAPDVIRTESGFTGQRKPIHFEVHIDDARPLSFSTELELRCSNTTKWGHRWYPGDGRPVPFHWNGGRLRVREPATTDEHWRGVSTMVARETSDGLEGHMRSVWRFEKADGREHVVCDSGYVPFAVGKGAEQRVPRMPRQASLWVVYPAPSDRVAPRHAGFAARVDRVCERAERRRPSLDHDGFDSYVNWHATEWGSLSLLRPPPPARSAYEDWLTGFERLVLAEHEQLERWLEGDLDRAARIAVEVDLLEAEVNAAAGRLGLKACG